MKKFICEDADKKGYPIPGSGCGEISHIIFDGYGFGDKQLEGVMFKASIVRGKVVVGTVDDWNEGYCKGLNKKHWLKEAREYQAENDIATCPKCNNDVDAQPRE